MPQGNSGVLGYLIMNTRVLLLPMCPPKVKMSLLRGLHAAAAVLHNVEVCVCNVTTHANTDGLLKNECILSTHYQTGAVYLSHPLPAPLFQLISEKSYIFIT